MVSVSLPIGLMLHIMLICMYINVSRGIGRHLGLAGLDRINLYGKNQIPMGKLQRVGAMTPFAPSSLSLNQTPSYTYYYFIIMITYITVTPETVYTAGNTGIT